MFQLTRDVHQHPCPCCFAGWKNVHDAAEIYTPQLLALLDEDTTLSGLMDLAGITHTYVGNYDARENEIVFGEIRFQDELSNRPVSGSIQRLHCQDGKSLRRRLEWASFLSLLC